MKEEGHRKHGDKTEIIETTIIPEVSQSALPTNTYNQQVSYTYGEPQIISSQPISTSDIPISSINQEQPGTTVRKIIDKTTIEHHENKKEKVKDKVKDATNKILGFIPNPFGHKEENQESHTPTNSNANVLAEENRPGNEGGFKTKTVIQHPSTGQTDLSCSANKVKKL